VYKFAAGKVSKVPFLHISMFEWNWLVSFRVRDGKVHKIMYLILKYLFH